MASAESRLKTLLKVLVTEIVSILLLTTKKELFDSTSNRKEEYEENGLLDEKTVQQAHSIA